MGTCIARTMLFSDRAAGHCREGQHSHVACGWQAPQIGRCARDANVSKLRNPLGRKPVTQTRTTAHDVDGIHKQRTHGFKMSAVSNLIASGSNANARVALRSPLSESSVQQCNETHVDSVHAERKNQRYTYERCRSRETKADLRQTATCGAAGCFAHPSPGIDEYVGPTL